MYILIISIYDRQDKTIKIATSNYDSKERATDEAKEKAKTLKSLDIPVGWDCSRNPKYLRLCMKCPK